MSANEEILRRLGSIETKLDNIMSDLHSGATMMARHDERIQKLRAEHKSLTGKLWGLLAGIIMMIGKWIWDQVSKT